MKGHLSLQGATLLVCEDYVLLLEGAPDDANFQGTSSGMQASDDEALAVQGCRAVKLNSNLWSKLKAALALQV